MSFGRQFSTSSPVLTMSPQPPHQAPLGMAYQQAPPRSFGPSGHSTPIQPVRPAAAGRKRSRDEASENLEPDVSIVVPAPEPEEEWEYGPGMTLIKPSSRYVTDASSQSGTWVEEKKAADEQALQNLQEHCRTLRNSKSQRTDLAADFASTQTAKSVSGLGGPNNTSPEAPQAPVIDNFTMQLGIGWRRISEDQHIQAAARGWARFIENHYPVTNVRILLVSNGLQSYLVEANEGFFLFAENLRQGQFVSQNAQSALCNLQCSPPRFDGASVLIASDSPKVSPSPIAPAGTDTEMNVD